MRAVEPLGEPNPDVLGLPDMALMLSDVLVAFDHLKHTVTILANAYVDEADVEAARRASAIAEVRERLAGPLPRPRAAPASAREPVFEPNMPREAFEAMVARIVEYVHAGDAFQVVPVAALVGAARRSSRSRSTAGCARSTRRPYMYFLDFEDFQIVGASPEPLRHGHRAPRLDAADRRHAPARRRRRGGPRRSPPTCSPTRRSAPST